MMCMYVYVLPAGSSWGCMAVMVPLVFDMAWELGGQQYDNLIPSLSSVLVNLTTSVQSHVLRISDMHISSLACTRTRTYMHMHMHTHTRA